MSTLTFTDFDAYSDAIGDVEVDIRLLHAYQRTWSIRHFCLDSLRFQQSVEGSGVLSTGAMSGNGWGVYIQRSGRPILVNGKLMVHDSAVILPPRAEFCLSGQGSIAWHSVFIPNAVVEPLLDSSTAWSSVELVSDGQQALGQWMALLGKVFNRTNSGAHHVASDSASKLIQENLVLTLLDVLAETANVASISRMANNKRERLVTKAIESISDDSVCDLSVPSLARLIGASERTLLYAFRDLFVTATGPTACRLGATERWSSPRAVS